MQKIQRMLQKPIIILALIMAVLTFIYALGFATDIYPLSYHTDKSSKMFYVEGAELYDLIQPFNKLLLQYGLILVILAGLNFVFMSHTRRLYYISNYVSSIAYSAFAIWVGSQVIQYVMIFKSMYLQVDFERLKSVTEMLGLRYVKSTFMLDCGFILCIMLFVTAAIVLANLVMKTIWMREEKKASL
ncbi:MAG: hypothetical protein J5968_04035 [Oscillospiraceae bacterium]|nr:hypothetical protein [Oscillospiraceae bacterium]MBP1556606.1 hypothetical protein [Oscillospiraceae bacterium]